MVKKQDHNCPVSAYALTDGRAEQSLSDLEAFLQAEQKSEISVQFACGTMQPDGRLDLCKQQLGSTGLSKLEQSLSTSNLVKHILLGTNWLQSEGARTVGDIIARNRNLETIYLGCNGIESSGIEYLCNGIQANSTVNALWLKRNPIGAKGGALIADLLEKRGGITVLDLVNTDISGALPRLVDALLSPLGSQLCYLYLGENNLGAQDAVQLARLIERGNLKGLYLNANQLGDLGVEVLVRALRHNQKLQILTLGSNNLTSQSARTINESGLGRVKVLDLGVAQSAKAVGAPVNLLRDQGASDMALFFARNSDLIECSLAANQITDIGAERIFNSLENNRTLQRLVLGNKVSKRLRVQIYKRLQNNTAGQESLDKLNPYSSHVQSVYR